MNTKVNQALHTISFVLVVMVGIGGSFFLGASTRALLTYCIILVAVFEVASLALGKKFYSEKHTSYKLGLLATLLILLGIKTMMPDFFPALTITALSVNFIYNFYTLNRRTSIKRKQKKRLKS
ncbi:hypothetical protein [Anditalea andensis]|uniref:Uncharacterized protein n=1 Tax=Anditalea andensis TaxID=1048983 RepID=A0A074KWD7_9BACT|nr:hypothetical protein [Anditalea andensis]KEO73234.1 hypothetical protein EL17_12840 [Anditalea andensis]